MNYFKNLLIGSWLCWAIWEVPVLLAEELTTTYGWGGFTYDSLHAAEHALWSEPWFGAPYYRFNYTIPSPHRRDYHLPPTGDYVLRDRLTFKSGPAIHCYDAPLYDEFGNDFCSGASNCCSSIESFKAAAQATFASQDCPLTFPNPEDPWVQGNITGSAFPAVLPEQIKILHSDYTSHIVGVFGEGTTSLCGLEYPWNLTARAPGHCPGGYEGFSNLYLTCDTSTFARIAVNGASQAEPTDSCPAGNPCHPTTGDKTLSESDFSSPTLQLNRHYHARQMYDERAGMGKGWTHTYTGRLFWDGPILKMLSARGNVERFECFDSPTCTMYRSVNEAGLVLRPVPGGWELAEPSGEFRNYDNSGKLVGIEQRSGTYSEIAITYTSSDLVDQVIDQSGRSLQFNYTENNLVESVTLPDGNLIQYEYTTPPQDFTTNARFNLTKVIYQDLTKRHYHYEDEDAQGNPRFGHLLTGINDEKGAVFASYAYDGRGRVISSEHAGGAGLVTLNYTKRTGENFDWSITEVTTPSGEVVAYDMEPGPFRKPTDIEDSRGAVQVTYDPTTTWRDSRTDREGNLTTYTYADVNRPGYSGDSFV